MADRRADKSRYDWLLALRQERFELMEQLAKLPAGHGVLHPDHHGGRGGPGVPGGDEAGPNIKGALVGVESVTPEGLKAIFKNFNDSGDALVTKLQKFSEAGVYVLGSFIFGLPTDKLDTFMATADLAQKAGVAFAQFVMLSRSPAPSTSRSGRRQKPSRRAEGGRDPAHPLLADPVAQAARRSTRRTRCLSPDRDPRRHAAGLGPLLRAAKNIWSAVGDHQVA